MNYQSKKIAWEANELSIYNIYIYQSNIIYNIFINYIIPYSNS